MTETRTRGLVGGPRPRWLPAQLVGAAVRDQHRPHPGLRRAGLARTPGRSARRRTPHGGRRLLRAARLLDLRAGRRREGLDHRPAGRRRRGLAVPRGGHGARRPARGARSDRRLVRLVALARGARRAADPAGGRRVGRRTPDGDGARACAPAQPGAVPAGVLRARPRPGDVRRRARPSRHGGRAARGRALHPRGTDRPGPAAGTDHRRRPRDSPDAGPAGAAPRAYVCGPTGFVEHTIGLLLELGFTNKTIRAERFGPSGS